ncbi:hypothetical protein L6452_27883 [Arctium lappa]|uniref:Uncharacterized protein n=1 Tax=Arctium lappa TaxID=4217 RepID=A0ACB8ZVY3_ARCLA|nr:hypothetical protein L6452_27883 [Arctium lappa]
MAKRVDKGKVPMVNMEDDGFTVVVNKRHQMKQKGVGTSKGDGTPIASKDPFITSMVKSFRAFSKAKRGVWIQSESNSFVSLLDEDSRDDTEGVEESSDSCIPDSSDDGDESPLVLGVEGATSHLSSC